MDAATQAAVAVEVARYGAATEQIKMAAETAATAIWASTSDWYDPAVVAALAAQAARVSVAGQQAVLGATQEFVTSTVALVNGVRRPPIPRVTIPPVRRGAPPPLVHSRPAERFRKAVATGKSVEEALELALGRGGGLARTDISLRQRAAEILLLDELGVTTYRRVLRPELSKTGSCGLCIAAADRTYRTDELMPIHPPSCRCIVLPVVGDNDPGINLNREDLDRLYAEAGSNKAADLRRTRYQVNEHGEFGPVLTKAGEHFRGPGQVALEDDPERAARMLAVALPVLESLEDREAQGENVSAPLAYQREFVARLRRIVG